MSSDPMYNMTNQLNEAMTKLATMMKVGLIGMVGLLVLFVALRVFLARKQTRKVEQMITDAQVVLSKIVAAGIARPTMYNDEPMEIVDATPFDHAVSIAVNKAFDEDTTGLDDEVLVAGTEVTMHMMTVEEGHFCEHCKEQTGIAVTMLLQHPDGSAASLITKTACSTCHQVLAE